MVLNSATNGTKPSKKNGPRSNMMARVAGTDLPSMLVALDSIVSVIEGNLEGLCIIWRCAAAAKHSGALTTSKLETACDRIIECSQLGAEKIANRKTCRTTSTIERDFNQRQTSKSGDTSALDLLMLDQGFSKSLPPGPAVVCPPEEGLIQACPPTEIIVINNLLFLVLHIQRSTHG